MKGSTLIVGGTGKTGRRVAERLKARGVAVRIGSRPADPPFDWEGPKTWEPAMRSAAAVHVAYYPDLAVPGAADKIKAFAELAVKNGISPAPRARGCGLPTLTAWTAWNHVRAIAALAAAALLTVALCPPRS